MVTRSSEPTRSSDSGSPDPVFEESLVLDPRVLLDPRFLGMLHRELRARLGENDAAAVLLQTGFFQGLRDARHALEAEERAGAGSVEGPLSPLLAMTFAPVSPASPELRVRGLWPERLEAEAILGALGAPGEPACLVSAGYTSGWLSGMWDTDILALERCCGARGEAGCEFVAREAAAWRRDGDAVALRWLSDLPFAALRDLVTRQASEAPAPAPAPEMVFDPASPAIHVWGPVMVIPYSGEDTAASLEIVAGEPAVRDVSVVVVDLSGALIDAGFGAVALERTLEAIRSWGAEAILAGVSPLSQGVVRELEPSQFALHKDVGEAIAAAFQIVESQHHPT